MSITETSTTTTTTNTADDMVGALSSNAADETSNVPPATENATSQEIEDDALHREWVVWFDNPRLAPEGTSWKDNLKKCGSFNSISGFWRIFNNLKPASKLSQNSNYHVFREGIEPMWEDPANKRGGKFVLTIPKKDSKAGRCDEWWLYTVLAVVGETIDLNGDQVCGCVVSIRKTQDRIALWLKSSDKYLCSEIGARWKKALEMQTTPLKYQLHDDAAASGSSFKNEVRFEV